MIIETYSFLKDFVNNTTITASTNAPITYKIFFIIYSSDSIKITKKVKLLNFTILYKILPIKLSFSMVRQTSTLLMYLSL